MALSGGFGICLTLWSFYLREKSKIPCRLEVLHSSLSGGMITVVCWTVMYTEIFRLTKSVWPLVIMHIMEDAVINPLRLLGFVSVEKNQAFLFSLSVGMIPTVLYFTVGLVIRKRRGKSRNTEMRANKVTESRFLIMLPALAWIIWLSKIWKAIWRMSFCSLGSGNQRL